MPKKNEIGAAICRYENGKLVYGPFSEGTHTRVDVKIACPKGSRFHGIFHTHPGGVAYPSDVDVASGKRVGAKVLCINSDTERRCFNVDRL